MKRTLLLSFLFVVLFSATAMANDIEIAEEDFFQNEEGDVVPLYTYIGYVTVSLKIDKNGCASYNCSVSAPNQNVRMTLYLQRSGNLFLWDDVIFTFKTVYDNGKISKTYDLSPDDYSYRAKVVVDVLDSNGNIIETETVYSDTKRY